MRRALAILILLALPGWAGAQVLPQFYSGLSEPVCTSISIDTSGGTDVGDTLTCNTTWTQAVEEHFQWYDGVTPISGATSSSYDTSSEDAGDLINCRATARNAAGAVVAQSSSVELGSGVVPGGSIILLHSPDQVIADEGSANFTPTVLAGDVSGWTVDGLPTGASFNSSTGQITGTLSTVGHWATKITASNGTDSDSIVVAFVVYSSLASVADSDLSGSIYQLSTADRVSQLSENITVDAAAFATQADGVTIDLAGHTLTYNDAAPNTITNQDFDSFTGDDPDNWTVTGDAAHTNVVTASSYIWPRRLSEGDNVLQVLIDQGAWTAGTLSTGTPATITATAHGLSTGDHVILDGFSATTYGTASDEMIRGGYEATVTGPDTFTINADVSAVSDASGTWIKATCVESSSTSLPVNNRLYAATCFVSNDPGSDDDYDSSIKIVDASTGYELEKLKNGTSNAVDYFFTYYHTYTGSESQTRNFSPACVVKSASVANCKVQVYLSSTAADTIVHLARVRLSQAYDNAVFNKGPGSAPQSSNYSTSGWDTSVGRVAIVDSVGGGSIVQGQNQGFRGWAIFGSALYSEFIAHGFDIEVDSDDPSGIYLYQFGSGTVDVTDGDCTIADVSISCPNPHNVCRRFTQTNMIGINKWQGDVLIKDATIVDSPCQSFVATVDSTQSATYEDDWAYPRSSAPNAYAFVPKSNNVLLNCGCDSTGSDRSGRAVLVSAAHGTLQNVTITNFSGICREERSRESNSDVYMFALRIRNNEDGESTNGVMKNILIEDSDFSVECLSSEYAHTLFGGFIGMIYNAGTGMDTSSYQINNTIFSSVCSTGTGRGQALGIEDWRASCANLTLTDCTLISNDTCLMLHDGNSGVKTISGVDMDGTTWTKDATSSPGRAFSTIRAGYNSSSVTEDFNITSNTFNTGTAYDDVTVVAGTHDITVEP